MLVVLYCLLRLGLQSANSLAATLMVLRIFRQEVSTARPQERHLGLIFQYLELFHL